MRERDPGTSTVYYLGFRRMLYHHLSFLEHSGLMKDPNLDREGNICEIQRMLNHLDYLEREEVELTPVEGAVSEVVREKASQIIDMLRKPVQET